MSLDRSEKATEQVSGDEEVIREFVEWMRASLEGFLNRGDGGTRYVNIFMGMINFSRLVVADLEERMCGPDKESRVVFRRMFVQTLHDSLIRIHPPTDGNAVQG